MTKTNKHGVKFDNLVPEKTKIVIDGSEKTFLQLTEPNFIMVYTGGKLIEDPEKSGYGTVDFPIKNELKESRIIELFHIDSVEKIIN